MPKPLLERLHTTLSGALYFVPALIAFGTVAFAEQRISLALLLTADAMTMAALCRVLGFQRQARFLRVLLWSGSAYLAMLVAYTGLVAVLIGYPLSALLREGSLSATLAVSGAGVIAL